MSTESELVAEIKKWSKKLDDSLLKLSPVGDRGAKMSENIRAYRNDSEHFFKRGDLIRSFECLIWGWAILDLSREFEFFKTD